MYKFSFCVYSMRRLCSNPRLSRSNLHRRRQRRLSTYSFRSFLSTTRFSSGMNPCPYSKRRPSSICRLCSNLHCRSTNPFDYRRKRFVSSSGSASPDLWSSRSFWCMQMRPQRRVRTETAPTLRLKIFFSFYLYLSKYRKLSLLV